MTVLLGTLQPVTYGQSSGTFGVAPWPGLDGIVPEQGQPILLANAQPAIVPFNNGNNVTSASSSSNTPSNITGSPTAVQATAATTVTGSLFSYLLTVITDPFNHLIAVVVLLLIGHYLWKHFLKGLV